MRFTFGAMLVAASFLLAPAGHAALITFTTTLTGATENPPVVTAGTGTGTVVYDTASHNLTTTATFSGLTGNTTASHIHCCTTNPFAGNAIVATEVPSFTNLPLGVTSGSFTEVLDLSLVGSYNPAFVTANGGTAASAETALVAGLGAGKAYLNIHTSFVGSGEIRGLLAPVPEPASIAIVTLGLLGLGAVRRRARG